MVPSRFLLDVHRMALSTDTPIQYQQIAILKLAEVSFHVTLYKQNPAFQAKVGKDLRALGDTRTVARHLMGCEALPRNSGAGRIFAPNFELDIRNEY